MVNPVPMLTEGMTTAEVADCCDDVRRHRYRGTHEDPVGRSVGPLTIDGGDHPCDGSICMSFFAN